VARPRHNPHTGRYDMAEDDWELTYDASQDTYRYLPHGAKPTYGVANDRFANAPSGAVSRCMPQEGTWHMVPADWVVEYDVATGRYESVPPRR